MIKDPDSPLFDIKIVDLGLACHHPEGGVYMRAWVDENEGSYVECARVGLRIRLSYSPISVYSLIVTLSSSHTHALAMLSAFAGRVPLFQLEPTRWSQTPPYSPARGRLSRAMRTAIGMCVHPSLI